MSESSGYEKRDVNVRCIIITSIITTLILVIMIIALNELFIHEKEAVYSEQVLKPESVSLQELRKIEDDILNNYSLKDSTLNIYQIPIKKSMELLASEAEQINP